MRRIIKNWSYLLTSNVIQQIFGFVVLILLTQKLSPKEFGHFNVIISLATIFAVISNLGMNQVLIREFAVASDRVGDILIKVAPIRIFSFFFSIAIFILYYVVISGNRLDSLHLFVIAIILNLTLWDISESVAFGNKVTKYSSVLAITFSSTWAISIYLFPEKFFSLKAILIVYCLLNFFKAAGYLWIVVKKFIASSHERIASESAVLERKEIIKMTIPYMWLFAVVTISNQFPVQFLNVNSGAAEVGFYSVGNKLMIPVMVAISTACSSIFPFLTELHKYNKEQFIKYIKDGFRFILTFGTLIVIILTLTSKYWIVRIFGQEYSQAVVVFNFLVWFGVIGTIDSLLSLALSSSYKQNTLAILASLDFLIFLPLIYFGSHHGAYGMSLARVFAGMIILAYHWIVFVKILNIRLSVKEITALYGFFLLALSISLFVSDDFIQLKLLLILLVVLLFSFIRNSPVQYTMVTTYRFVKNQFTGSGPDSFKS
jgi:O-antigen/teichoic acid export membrane protein